MVVHFFKNSFNNLCFTTVTCKWPGCSFTVTYGTQWDKCEVFFHRAWMDPTASADNRLAKYDHKWVCGTCNINAEELLSYVVIILTGLRKKSLIRDSLRKLSLSINLFLHQHHDFRMDHFCITSMLTVVDRWTINPDHNRKFEVLHVDFLKTFDGINNMCSISKLKWLSIKSPLNAVEMPTSL